MSRVLSQNYLEFPITLRYNRLVDAKQRAVPAPTSAPSLQSAKALLTRAIPRNFLYIKNGLCPLPLPPQSAKRESLAHAGDFPQFPIHKKTGCARSHFRPSLQSAKVLLARAIPHNFLYIKNGLCPPPLPPQSAKRESLAHAGDFPQFPIHKKRAVPAPTSAPVCITRKPCSRGRFRTIS